MPGIGGFLKVALKEFFGSMLLYGSNSAGNQIKIRTDDQGLLRTRPYEPRKSVSSNPFAITVGGGLTTLYTCPASTVADVSVYVGPTGSSDPEIDFLVGGATFIDNMVLPSRVPPLFMGPFTLVAAQTMQIQALVGTVSVWVNAQEYSTGDTATGI